MKMKRTIAAVAALTMMCTIIPAAPAVYAETKSSAKTVTEESIKDRTGKLVISEAGEYTLTGKMTGTLYIEAADGDVSLILDNAVIDGGDGAAIVQVSGNLDISAKSGTTNTINGKGGAAVKSSGKITIKSGSFSVISDDCAFDAKELIIGSGKVSVTAKSIASENTLVSGSTDNIGLNNNSQEKTIPTASSVTVQSSGTSYSENSYAAANNSIQSSEPAAQDTNVTAGLQFAAEILSNTSDIINSGNKTEEISVDLPQDNSKNGQTPPENPDGNDNAGNGQTPPEKPDGNDNGENGQTPPEKPDGNNNGENGQTPPEKPDGNNNGENGQTPPEKPDGNDNAGNGQTPPEKPDGNNNGGNWQTPPEKPDGNDNAGNGQTPPDMPQNQMTAESTVDEPTEIAEGITENSAMSLTADYENASEIMLTDEDGSVTISNSGTYVITGSSSDGGITIKKNTTGVVLVLNDLDLTSTSGAALSVNKNAEVQIIVSGTVTLTDNEDPEDENSADEEIADAYDGAAVKVKADSVVFITGDGELNINGNAKNGIKGGDDSSIIIGGDVTVNITAANDGINGNYDVSILDGTISISAGDDAVHADHILTVGSDDDGPDITITDSEEGLEGTVVNIKNGNISINSNDDGINAANSDGTYADEIEFSINVTGGNISVNAGGDGLDSNGNINLIGGSTAIKSANNGGEAGIDYDGEFYISDDFDLNNSSGVAGPDNMMPGGAPGGMPGGAPGGPQNGASDGSN